MNTTFDSPAEARDVPRTGKTEICITIDTEFSAGGAFQNPSRYRPISTEIVECRVHEREEGLGFLLRSFREHGVRATFFAETLQTFYYGQNPMGVIVQRIASEGHDVQIHLHPAWLYFRDRGWRVLEESNDSCAGRDLLELESLIKYSCDVFARWGLPRPIALRAGSFQCDRTLYRAMHRCGLPLASNVADGLYRQPDPALRFVSGRHLVEGVMEIPVLGYATTLPLMAPRVRSTALTATSWREIETLLWAAREKNISPVVILTHPFEFVKRDDFRYSFLRRNRLNQFRLGKLLEFINRNAGEFAAATFAGNGQQWLADGASASTLLFLPQSLAVMRAAQNFINDHI